MAVVFVCKWVFCVSVRFVWCGVVWCGVVWSGVMWCGVGKDGSPITRDESHRSEPAPQSRIL